MLSLQASAAHRCCCSAPQAKAVQLQQLEAVIAAKLQAGSSTTEGKVQRSSERVREDWAKKNLKIIELTPEQAAQVAQLRQKVRGSTCAVQCPAGIATAIAASGADTSRLAATQILCAVWLDVTH